MKKMFFLILLISGVVMAKDFALIVAIGNYKNNDFNLNSTQITNDIELYKKILTIKKKVSLNDIKILRDKHATRKNILSYLEKVSKWKEPYRFFMFFSGHGLNKEKEGSSIKDKLKDTGAILPYDFNPHDIYNTIIIGKKDLRTYFKIIDEKATGNPLIIFDACFSKNSIKGKKGIKNDETPFVYTDKISSNYPYKNIIYIGASTNKASQGNLTKVLNDCLFSQKYNKNKIKSCLNSHDSGAGQFVFLRN